MTIPTRGEFVEQVGGLDRAALTEFVADLYAARGWTTEVVCTGVVVASTMRDGGAETREVRVRKSVPADPIDCDEVVVGARREIEATPDGPRFVDAGALYEMALYAIERDDLSALLADHLDPDGFGGADRPTRRLLDAGHSLSVAAPEGSLAVLAAAVLVLAGITLAAGVGFVGSELQERGIEQTVTPAASVEPPASASPTAYQSPCPAPSSDVHPALLRPAPPSTAVSVGLDGWVHVRGVNTSVFQGPNELEIPWTPGVRHQSTYRSPRENTLVLVADRWVNRRVATKAGPALRSRYQTAIVWGTFTVAVAVLDASVQNTSTPTSATEDEASLASAETYVLLSEVTHPTDGKLGIRCTRRLAEATS